MSNDDNNIALTIKWGKETIELSLPEATLTYKSLTTELEERTGVPVDRMKLMAKSKSLWKGVLKEGMVVDWRAAVAANGGNNTSSLNLLLMGSATKLVKPTTKTVFLEDLAPEEIAKVVEPSGLVNLGNTCYMNSVLQCLRAVPSLRHGLLQQQRLPLDELQQAYSSGQPDLSAFTTNPQQGSVEVQQQPSFLLASAVSVTLHSLDRQSDALRPLHLLQAMQVNFPQFAEMTPAGHGHGPIPKQQDAEEFYSCLLSALATQTKHRRVIEQGLAHAADTSRKIGLTYYSTGAQTAAAVPATTTSALDGATNLIDALFGMKVKSTLTCDEVPDGAEPPVVSYDLHRKLVCNIRGSEQAPAAPTSSAEVAVNATSGNSTNVTNIYEGLAVGLKGSIEKHSAVLGRNAIWTSIQRLERLPTILTVQFGRFFWKETPDSQDHTGVKCKVLKSVAFGATLDIYDYCTPEVQSILAKARAKALAVEEERMNQKLAGKDVHQPMEDAAAAAVEDAAKKEDENDVAMDEDEAALQAALAMSLKEGDENGDGSAADAAAADADETLPPVGPGLPRNFQGHYELFAVVTHKGRDADGGHYMAWVKADTEGVPSKKIPDSTEDNEDWYVFDDDEVSPCKTEDVLKLKGGGDWHMSYLNFYRPKK